MPTQRITIDIETHEDPSSVLDAAQEIAHELASQIDGAADDDLVSVEDLESVQSRRAGRNEYRHRLETQADTMRQQIARARAHYGLTETAWTDLTRDPSYATPQ